MQGKTTWPGNVQATSEEGGYDLSLNNGLFDDGIHFVRGDATVPDRLSCRSTDLKTRNDGDRDGGDGGNETLVSFDGVSKDKMIR